MTGTERRREALKRIESYVCADRQNAYGDAEDNFAVIAEYWNIFLENKLAKPNKLTSADIAAMMCLVKLSRMKSSPNNQDNWDDLAGYAVCGAGIVSRRKEDEPIPKVNERKVCRACAAFNDKGAEKCFICGWKQFSI